jgi:ATP-dependent Lhr-like helicase
VAIPQPFFDELARTRRATRVRSLWVAAERLPEMLAVHAGAPLRPAIAAPAGRAAQTWTREDAVVELFRGRVAILGATTVAALAQSLGITDADAEAALLALESHGVVLRGTFTDGAGLEFCDRALLARIHRYTLNRLRAEIEPVSRADFMRFLFVWQSVDPAHRLTGDEGLRATLARLDGFELPAQAWERVVLRARVDRYDPQWLDLLCLTGHAAWGRLSIAPREPAGSQRLRVALFLGEHADAWQRLRIADEERRDALEQDLNEAAETVLRTLRSRGASFTRDLARSTGLEGDALSSAIVTLAARGLATSDSFAGARAITRRLRQQTPFDRRQDLAGRWSAMTAVISPQARDEAVDTQARALLERYGIVFRAVLGRETNAATWRELTRVYRRLEARGEIRGGRFVAGASGEQFALSGAVERLREVRRGGADGRLITISGVDPLNLTGVLTSGDRIRAITSTRIVYRDGVALAALEGDYMRPLAEIEPASAGAVASALAGRRVPAVTSGFIGR